MWAWEASSLSQEDLQSEQIVNTKYGPIKGLLFNNFRRFQGVPFAAPPLGPLRFKNPVRPGGWTNVLDCTNFTIGCAQTAHSEDVPKNTSEDCLYLQIFTPRLGKYKDPAPVMLFFHGGDFKQGGESFELYNGSFISGNTNTIVVITDYRLGIFGFLYNGINVDSNVGLEDQRMALTWIQENIQFFGGDPNKVTIFGESAGGESVLVHLASPNATTANYFHRAIVESGPFALNFRTTTEGYVLAEGFAYELGCSIDDLNCLQSKTTKEILDAANNAPEVPLDISEAVMKFAPIVTGDNQLPSEPFDAFLSGKIKNVPFMIGSNLNDGRLFGWAISKTPMPAYEYIAIVTGIFHDTWIPTVLEMYPANYSGDNRDITSEMLNDYLFLCDSRRALRYAQNAGLKDLYYYQFTKVPPFCPWPSSQKFCCDYVCHGDEIPYVFFDSGDPYPWNMTGPDSSLAQSMAYYWASFAVEGNPNVFNQPTNIQWPIYTQQNDISMNLNWPLATVTGLKKDKCDIWDQIGYDNLTKLIRALRKSNLKRN
uniref:Carboxylic ester hydrolase n=1 Tax=Arcella intermedia TaxID=1963864 RepID=A0A6B2L168_9EUKA